MLSRRITSVAPDMDHLNDKECFSRPEKCCLKRTKETWRTLIHSCEMAQRLREQKFVVIRWVDKAGRHTFSCLHRESGVHDDEG